MPAILQPVAGRCHPMTENLVRELGAQEGWRVVRAFGSLGVDRVRSHLASQFLSLDLPKEDWAFWIDSDMIGSVNDVLDLLKSAQEHDAAMMVAPSICRQSHDLNIRPMSHGAITLGPDGCVIELEKGAFAFTITHRRLFEAVIPTLPEVEYTDDGTGEVFQGWPFFMPIIRNRTHYGEDYSMSLRARDAGVRLYADTRVRNWHAAEELISWEQLEGARPKEMPK